MLNIIKHYTFENYFNAFFKISLSSVAYLSGILILLLAAFISAIILLFFYNLALILAISSF
jgi:hypothetical protein